MIRRICFGAALVAFANTLLPGAAAGPRHPTVSTLSSNSRELFSESMQWGDRYYDAQAHLCRMPASAAYGAPRTAPHPVVRESAWYALGLLLRDGSGDRQRAAEILDAVLNAQYHEPGKPWDGTFRRTPAEPEPGPEAVMWRAYDPNWREFVGTTLAIILNEYPDRIPAALRGRMMPAIDDAVAGEMKQGRLVPTYTNPALMYGFLWEYAAVHGGHPEWKQGAARWMDTVYRLYKEHGAFFEFNSPTYAGVDFFALALWRDYGDTPQMRSRGREMEAGLWRTTAGLYNANLRNISGPYDRSYGMDMRSYVSVTGLWLRTVLDAEQAPLPPLTEPVDHPDDVWFVPPIVVLDTEIPADAMRKFKSFPGAHAVRQPIAGPRIATAWIAPTLIYGGEITGHSRGVDRHSQFHPVTVQWLVPDGSIGWIQLTSCPPIDAGATQAGIAITAQGDVAFRIRAPGLIPQQLTRALWHLPGLTVRVNSDAASFTATQTGPFVDVAYKSGTRMTLFLPHGE